MSRVLQGNTHFVLLAGVFEKNLERNLLGCLELGSLFFAFAIHGAATTETAAVAALAPAFALALPFALAFSLTVGGTGGARGTGLGVGGGEDLLGKVQLLAQEGEAILGGGIGFRGLADEIVMPLPVKDLLQVAAGLERTADHVDLEVPDVLELIVAVLEWILLNDHDALLEKVGEHLTALLSGDHNHLEKCVK